MNKRDTLITFHAPADRDSIETVKRQRDLVNSVPQIRAFLDAVPDVYLTLNDKRQIVFANKTFIDFIGVSDDPDKVLGMRVGEAVDCVHAFKMEAGCGTSEFCKNCGAVNAMVSALRGSEDLEECSIERKNSGDSFDFRVWSQPYDIEGEKFIFFAIKDISHEKRRRALERIFFHDIVNTVGSLKGMTEMIKFEDEIDRIKQYSGLVYDLSLRLLDEIYAQKQLAAAEARELKPKLQEFISSEFLSDIQQSYSHHLSAHGKFVEIDPEAQTFDLKTDYTLLSRVVGNMTKNALEASLEGRTVRIGCEKKDDEAVFWVKNSGRIPEYARLQIFKRSFSTKGDNRGLGTYSMKLLTERYLLGKVDFETSEDKGTTFRAIIPRDLKPDYKSFL